MARALVGDRVEGDDAGPDHHHLLSADDTVPLGVDEAVVVPADGLHLGELPQRDVALLHLDAVDEAQVAAADAAIALAFLDGKLGTVEDDDGLLDGLLSDAQLALVDVVADLDALVGGAGVVGGDGHPYPFVVGVVGHRPKPVPPKGLRARALSGFSPALGR